MKTCVWDIKMQFSFIMLTSGQLHGHKNWNIIEVKVSNVQWLLCMYKIFFFDVGRRLSSNLNLRKVNCILSWIISKRVLTFSDATLTKTSLPIINMYNKSLDRVLLIWMLLDFISKLWKLVSKSHKFFDVLQIL